MPDRILRCKDCGTDFPFTQADQERFRQKDYEDPKRCPSCREIKKSRFANGQPQRRSPQPTNREHSNSGTKQNRGRGGNSHRGRGNPSRGRW